MRRRLLAAFLLLDGLCALALPAAGALLAPPAHAAGAAYVEIAGTCVATIPAAGDALMGTPVEMDLCAD